MAQHFWKLKRGLHWEWKHIQNGNWLCRRYSLVTIWGCSKIENRISRPAKPLSCLTCEDKKMRGRLRKQVPKEKKWNQRILRAVGQQRMHSQFRGAQKILIFYLNGNLLSLENAPFIIYFWPYYECRGLLKVLRKLTKVSNISDAIYYFTLDLKIYKHIYRYNSYNKINHGWHAY